jgi:hypothetical protein
MRPGFDGKDNVRATGGCLFCAANLCCGDLRCVPRTPNLSLVLLIDIQEQGKFSGAVRYSTEAPWRSIPQSRPIDLRRALHGRILLAAVISIDHLGLVTSWTSPCS